jgi:hypothetical protein
LRTNLSETCRYAASVSGVNQASRSVMTVKASDPFALPRGRPRGLSLADPPA